MTERVIVALDSTDFPDKQSFADAFKRSLDALDANCIPRNVREENAKRCRDILAKAGVESGGIEAARSLVSLTEDSAERLAAEWLGSYRHIEALKEKAAAGDRRAINDLIDEAEHLGVIQERMWWRRGIDPQTGKRREELALGKRAQEKAIPKATEARRVQAQDTKPDWHDSATLDALEIRRRHPSFSRWRIAGKIYEKFGVSRNRCDKVLRANGIK